MADPEIGKADSKKKRRRRVETEAARLFFQTIHQSLQKGSESCRTQSKR
jgi:hypothetical protein